jgi:hypothetical protein
MVPLLSKRRISAPNGRIAATSGRDTQWAGRQGAIWPGPPDAALRPSRCWRETAVSAAERAPGGAEIAFPRLPGVVWPSLLLRGLRRRLPGGAPGSCGFVVLPQGQGDAFPFRIRFQHLDPDHLPGFDHLAGIGNEPVGQRGHVNEPILVHPDVNERPKRRYIGHGSLQHHSRPEVGDLFDPFRERRRCEGRADGLGRHYPEWGPGYFRPGRGFGVGVRRPRAPLARGPPGRIAGLRS